MSHDHLYPFEFSGELDIAFLNDLFDGDMRYAEVVFSDFLKELPTYWREVEDAFAQKNILAVKSAVHKCKTLFGYVGHTQVLNRFQTFENKCGTAKDIQDIAADYHELVKTKAIAHEIIEKEYQRLKKYHQRA